MSLLTGLPNPKPKVPKGRQQACIRYVENHVTFHATEDIQDEFLRLLEMACIEYDERYLLG